MTERYKLFLLDVQQGDCTNSHYYMSDIELTALFVLFKLILRTSRGFY